MNIVPYLLYDLNFMRFRYWYKNRKFLPLYEEKSKSNYKGSIIYMCDGKWQAGGLADRLFGIISLFIFCEQQNIPFYINFTHPFKLEDYFVPNGYNWKLSEPLCFNKKYSIPLLMAGSYLSHNGTVEQESTFMKRYLISKYNKEREFHIYTNMHYAISGPLYSDVFHKLFKNSDSLENELQTRKRQIGQEYISVTLRFQNLLGDFPEADFKSVCEFEQKVLINKVVEKINEIHLSFPKDKILVTSDSKKFLDVVSSLKYVCVIPGDIVHMSYTRDYSYQTHLKSFVDLMMLADSKHLHLLVTGDMYASGFAKMASLINNKPYSEIVF